MVTEGDGPHSPEKRERQYGMFMGLLDWNDESNKTMYNQILDLPSWTLVPDRTKKHIDRLTNAEISQCFS